MKHLSKFVVLISYTFFAHAGEYKPYDGSARQYHIDSPFSPKTEAMEFKDKKIYFWKQIKENYESILTKASWNKSSVQCKSFLTEPLPGVIGGNSCQTVKLISDENVCLELEFPEKMYRNQSLKSYEKSQMDSMKGFLQMSIGPILTLDIPSFMFTQKNYYHFRQAMWRLYNNELIQKINIAQQNIDKVSVENCFQSTNQAKARLSLQNRRSDLQRLKSQIHESLAAALAENKADVANLKASGYCPRGLSTSYLTRADKVVLSGVAGALAWRMRGNGIWMKESTSQQREDFAGRVFEMIALFNDQESPGLAKKINSSTRNRARKGWGDIFDIGTEDGDVDTDLDLMTERGNYQAGKTDDLLASSPMDALKDAGFDHTPLHVGGLQMGICYLVPQYGIPHTKDYYFGREWKTPLVGFINSRLSYGEVCVGAALGLGLGYSLSKGPKCDAENKTLINIIKAPISFTKNVFGKADELIKLTNKEEQKEADKKKVAAEQKAAQQKAAQQKAAEQKAAEQKAAEQKAAEQKAAQRRAAEQKAAQQKAAEQKAAQRRAAELKATQQKATNKKK